MADCVVVGPGGVGGYLTSVLAAGGLEVAVVARRAHADAIERHGLRLDDPQRPDAPPPRLQVARTPADARAGAGARPAERGCPPLGGGRPPAAPGRRGGAAFYFSAPGGGRAFSGGGGAPRLSRLGPLDTADAALRGRAADIAARWSTA